jgi:hypothetical protein
MTKTKMNRLAVALAAASLLAACSGSAVDGASDDEPTLPTPGAVAAAPTLAAPVAAKPVAEAPAGPVVAPEPEAPATVLPEPEAAPEPEPAVTPEPVEEPAPEPTPEPPIETPAPLGLYDACTLEAQCPEALTCARSSDATFSGAVCRPAPTVAYGEACTYDDECRTEFCGPSALPGQRMCSRVRIPLGTGDMCDTDDQCGSNRCDFQYGVFSCCTYSRTHYGRTDCIQ